jgi:hypothetical protein
MSIDELLPRPERVRDEPRQEIRSISEVENLIWKDRPSSVFFKRALLT